MLTPEKLSAQKFDKVLIWGYDMNAVDSFLEQVEADYTALYNENATLADKLKYLTGKVDEYRQVDEAMRKALLQAQVIADDTIARAKEESARYKESVREGLMLELKDLTDQIQAEKKRLGEARRVTRRYIDLTLSRYASEEKNLSDLRDREFSDIPAEEPVPEPDEQSVSESAAASSVSAFSEPIPTVSLFDNDLDLTKVFSSAIPKPAEDRSLTEDTLTVPIPISVADEASETVPPVFESADAETEGLEIDITSAADMSDTDVPVADESDDTVPETPESASGADIFYEKSTETAKSDSLPKSEGFLNPFWEDLWDAEIETKEPSDASSESLEISDNDEFTEDLTEDITLPSFNMSAAPHRKSVPAQKAASSFRLPKLSFGRSGQKPAGKSISHQKPFKTKKK